MKIKANGIHMNYELSGKEDPPVVMLSHSLASCLGMWKPQIDALSAHYRVLCYDTRGHGGTDAPGKAYTLEQLGDDALGLLDALGIDRVNWVGLSMGGMIGQCVALNHPERFKSLCLSDTAAALPGEADPVWRERIDMAGERGMEPLVRSTLERWFTLPYLALNPPEVEKIRQIFLKTSVEG